MKEAFDCMPKEQFEFISKIQADLLESTNLTKEDAWRFGFLCWQNGYAKAEYGNDVCEWKNEKGIFIQNPHTGRKFSNEPSMKNVYCNTCGKKIKVVGNYRNPTTD